MVSWGLGLQNSMGVQSWPRAPRGKTGDDILLGFLQPCSGFLPPIYLGARTEECIVLAWSNMILQHEEGGLMAEGHSRDRWQCILKGCDEEEEREMVRSQLHMLACQEGGDYDMSTIEVLPSLAQGTREAALSL